MKKVFVAMLLLVAFCGCQEELKAPSKSSQLLPTAPQWQRAYGDDDETRLYSNVWVLTQVVKSMEEKLSVVEAKLEKAIMDGGEVKMKQKSKYIKPELPVLVHKIYKVDPNK